MQDGFLTRRRFVLGTVGAGAVLAGCVDDAGSSGDEGVGTDTAGSPPATDSTTAAGSGSPETDTETPVDTSGLCGPLAGSPTAYDVSGTPYVFAFDYPETWTVEEPIPNQSTGRFQRVTSPPVSIDGDEGTATVRVGQSFEALTASDVDSQVEEITTRDIDPLTVVDEQTYDGETVRVFGYADDSTAYPTLYLLYLPHGSGDGRRYYLMNLVAFSDIHGLEGEQQQSCYARIEAAIETVRSSLRPNPQTTIESV